MPIRVVGNMQQRMMDVLFGVYRIYRPGPEIRVMVHFVAAGKIIVVTAPSRVDKVKCKIGIYRSPIRVQDKSSAAGGRV
jgi:hypothetical protein